MGGRARSAPCPDSSMDFDEGAMIALHASDEPNPSRALEDNLSLNEVAARLQLLSQVTCERNEEDPCVCLHATDVPRILSARDFHALYWDAWKDLEKRARAMCAKRDYSEDEPVTSLFLRLIRMRRDKLAKGDAPTSAAKAEDRLLHSCIVT